MPIFEYQCQKCSKKLEAFQHHRNSLSFCDEVDSSCKEHGEIERLISSFAFQSGNISSEMSSGCGCHGTASCPGSFMNGLN